MSDSVLKAAQVRAWLFTASAGVLLFVAATAIFLGALWAVNELTDDRSVLLAVSVIFGLAFLLAIIAGIVAAFSALRLTSPRTALGLPEGSIRAIIALLLVLIFVIMAIYLIEAVFIGGETDDEDARNAATQLLATVGTLVAAVAAFYFGSGAVTTGTVAATAAAEAARGLELPVAITKGSTQKDGGYELVGVVNPRGRETKYFFEYGESETYGGVTAVASAGSGKTDGEVRSAVIPEMTKGWHLRLVAFSDAGTTYGADSIVGGSS